MTEAASTPSTQTRRLCWQLGCVIAGTLLLAILVWPAALAATFLCASLTVRLWRTAAPPRTPRILALVAVGALVAAGGLTIVATFAWSAYAAVQLGGLISSS